MVGSVTRPGLLVELILLFVIGPALVVVSDRSVYVLSFLVLVVLWCLVFLLRDKRFERRRLWNAGSLRLAWRRILVIGLGQYFYHGAVN